MKRRSFLAALAVPFIKIPLMGNLLTIPEPDQGEVSDVFDLFRIVNPDKLMLEYQEEYRHLKDSRQSWTYKHTIAEDGPTFCFVPYVEYYVYGDVGKKNISNPVALRRLKETMHASIQERIRKDLLGCLVASGLDHTEKIDGDVTVPFDLAIQDWYKRIAKEDPDGDISIWVKKDQNKFIIGQPDWGKFKVQQESPTRFKAIQISSAILLDSRNVQLFSTEYETELSHV
jgi:hypothetical protein